MNDHAETTKHEAPPELGGSDSRRLLGIEIELQGLPIVNSGTVVARGDCVIAADIDLSSKYCEVSAFTSGSDGIPGVHIDAGEFGLHLKDGAEGGTWLRFPELQGWNVWAANIGRYTLAICFVKYP